MQVELLETAATAATQQKGLYHSNLVAAFEFSERRSTLVARFIDTVSRAFNKMGLASETEGVIWNLLANNDIRENEILEKSTELIDGLRAILGGAGTSVFEYMWKREIVREFGLVAAVGPEILEERSIPELVRLITHLVQA
jgi:hypothetical protein